MYGDLTYEVCDFKSHLLDLTLEHPQIDPIFHIEAEWLHLTPFIVLISQDQPNHRFWGIVTDQYDLLD